MRDGGEQDRGNDGGDGAVVVGVEAVGDSMRTDARNELGASDNRAEETAAPERRALIKCAPAVVPEVGIAPVLPKERRTVVSHLASLADTLSGLARAAPVLRFSGDEMGARNKVWQERNLPVGVDAVNSLATVPPFPDNPDRQREGGQVGHLILAKFAVAKEPGLPHGAVVVRVVGSSEQKW